MDLADPVGRFLTHAVQTPDQPAVDLGDSVVTYGELAASARKFASLFSAVPGPRVLIALPQGPNAYAAMIGSLLCGGYYVPVNTASPTRKIARIVELAQPDILVAEGKLAEELARLAPGAQLVDPGRLGSVEPFEGLGVRHDIAYVIFTSGSTGLPKGVVVSTAAFAHYVNWLSAEQVFRPDDRVSQFPSIGFDLSVLDIYGALNAGATLVTPVTSGDRLFAGDFARRSRISLWVSVPSAISLVAQGGQATPEFFGGIRLFMFCGEALRRPQLEAIFTANPAAVVMNLYGPTEATVSMTSTFIGSDNYERFCADSVALGEPIPDMGLHLVGDDKDAVGEIVITGPQLAQGYWRDAERTEQAFRTVKIGDRTLRGYFTGDLGERIDGQTFFRGRSDHQVKISGHRLETGEIVARLADCGWPVACVVKHRDALTAVVEAVPGKTFDAAALRSTLLKELEVYAVPSFIFCIERMPRNDNEKLDEIAVREWLDGSGQ